jgi:hypothetical protein
LPTADLIVVLYVPLRRRDGSVCAWAKVDAADAPLVTPYRWHLDGDGYARRSIPGGPYRQRALLLHRALLGLRDGDPRQGDHRNRNRLDSRRSNLRIVTHAQNGQNRCGHSATTSEHRGVSLHRLTGKWQANATLNRRRYYLGLFDDEDTAAAAVAAWRREHMPFSEEVAP